MFIDYADRIDSSSKLEEKMREIEMLLTRIGVNDAILNNGFIFSGICKVGEEWGHDVYTAMYFRPCIERADLRLAGIRIRVMSVMHELQERLCQYENAKFYHDVSSPIPQSFSPPNIVKISGDISVSNVASSTKTLKFSIWHSHRSPWRTNFLEVLDSQMKEYHKQLIDLKKQEIHNEAFL